MQNMQELSMRASRDKLVRQLCDSFEKSRVTQQQIANGSGVHQSQVSRILRGEFKRMTRNVVKICKYANVAPGQVASKGSLAAELTSLLKQLCDGTSEREKTLLRLLKAIRDL